MKEAKVQRHVCEVGVTSVYHGLKGDAAALGVKGEPIKIHLAGSG